ASLPLSTTTTSSESSPALAKRVLRAPSSQRLPLWETMIAQTTCIAEPTSRIPPSLRLRPLRRGESQVPLRAFPRYDEDNLGQAERAGMAASGKAARGSGSRSAPRAWVHQER